MAQFSVEITRLSGSVLGGNQQFPQKDGAKSAFTLKLDFPVGATELVLFEPKDAPDDQE